MGLKVIAPLVIVSDGEGRMYHYYQDAVLPDEGLDKDHVKQLVADGMVLDEKAAAKADATPDDGESPAPKTPAKKTASKSAASK